MNRLLDAYVFLTAGLRADPLTCLANAVCWLDPLWGDDWDAADDDDGALSTALHVTRTAFPDLYVQAVELLRQGATNADLDRLICQGITQRGIPVDGLDWIGYGIPLPAYGVVLDDPDFYTTHPELIPVLDCFGISPEPNPYQIDVPDCAYIAGRLIAADLEHHADERYRQLSWLMQWLFSCSGNSTIDYDDETMSEFQPLSWDSEDVAFAVEIIEEADGIMDEALAGLAFFQAQPSVRAALQTNIRRIYRVLKRKGIKANDQLHLRLEWPPVGDCLAGATELVLKSYSFGVLIHQQRISIQGTSANTACQFSYAKGAILLIFSKN